MPPIRPASAGRPAQEILRPADHPLQRSGGGLWRLEEHHLHLVELVDAQDPAGILAGRAGLPAEAGRVGGIADGQLAEFEDLVAVEIRDRDPVSYTHLRAHETDSYLVCRLLLE